VAAEAEGAALRAAPALGQQQGRRWRQRRPLLPKLLVLVLLVVLLFLLQVLLLLELLLRLVVDTKHVDATRAAKAPHELALLGDHRDHVLNGDGPGGVDGKPEVVVPVRGALRHDPRR
jgi:hypothetical protein